MKKLLSVLLALVMTLTAAAPALAAEAPPVAEDVPQTAEAAPAAEMAPVADTAQGREVPLTFHGWSESIALHCDFLADGEEVTVLEDGSLQDTVLAGADFSVVMAAGYGLEVMAGGSVTGSHTPDDPAFPEGTEYDVHVNEDAEAVVLAAVCTGEGAVVPSETETEEQTVETAPIADAPMTDESAPQEAVPAEETIPETAPEAEVPEAPEGEAVPEQEAPEAAAAQGLAVTLAGPVEAVKSLVYTGADGELVNCDAFDGETLPTAVTVPAGGEVRLFMDAAYNVAVENVTITENTFTVVPYALGPGPNGHQRYELSANRWVVMTLGQTGAVTINIVPTEGPIPELVPYTFYNDEWYDNGGGIVGGGGSSDSSYGWSAVTVEDGTITTGGVLEEWTAPGYEIQVLEGGHVVETHEPTGPAASDIPAGSTAYVLMVDLGAKAFTIACVREGETFTIPEEHPATGTFKDVPDDSWYKDVVEQAYASGMISGTSADTFSPNAPASRGQTVAMLYREAGCPDVDAPVTFGDLTADYYKDAVKWAAAIGAVQGVSETEFAPDQAVTRQQLAAMLYRMAGQPGIWAGGMMEDYTDAYSIAEYARGPMQWALDNGIIKGYGDRTMRPNATATRAEVCAMLVRYNEVIALYPDDPVWWAGPGSGTGGTGAEEQAEAETETVTQEQTQTVSHTGWNLDNPKLIKPKRDKIDDGLYSNDETADQFYQQWAETLWGLDRSGEDIMWCTRYLTRLRSGPGEQYDVVWTVNENNEVSRLGPDENGWTPVVYHQYVTSEGFTGWDYTGYLPTKYLTDQKPAHPTVQPTTGPELEAWFNYGMDAPVPEGYGMEYLERMEKENPFQFQEYEPASIDGSTYTYKISGGGTVRIHNVVPEGLTRVSTSERVKDDTLSVSIMVERGYGIDGPSGFMSNNLSLNPWGCGLTQSADYSKCWVTGGAELNRGEDVDFYMTSGDEAPRVLQVSAKNTAGGLRMAEACHQFILLDKDGNPPDSYMDFFNLWNGYKLKSLSPYVTIGKVENELHYFKVSQVPAGIDQVFVEVTR